MLFEFKLLSRNILKYSQLLQSGQFAEHVKLATNFTLNFQVYHKLYGKIASAGAASIL